MNILLIDDHIMTLEGYASILNADNSTFFKAQNCETVYDLIHSDITFDITVIDHNLPPFSEQKLFSGIDCALLLKERQPGCKIILITAHIEFIELYTMYKKVKPSALIVKEDLMADCLRSLVYATESTIYLSNRFKKAVTFVRDKLSLLNETNVEILMYLSKGFKINELADIVGLSKRPYKNVLLKCSWN